jgi:hypothetical protein
VNLECTFGLEKSRCCTQEQSSVTLRDFWCPKGILRPRWRKRGRAIAAREAVWSESQRVADVWKASAEPCGQLNCERAKAALCLSDSKGSRCLDGIYGTLRLSRVMRMHEARSVVSAKRVGQNVSDDLGGCHAPVKEQALGVVRRDEGAGVGK